MIFYLSILQNTIKEINNQYVDYLLENILKFIN